MLRLFLCCPRMNLLLFTPTTWKVERHSVLRTKAVNGYNKCSFELSSKNRKNGDIVDEAPNPCGDAELQDSQRRPLRLGLNKTTGPANTTLN